MYKQLFLLLIFTIPLLVNAQNLHIIRPDGSLKPIQQSEILPSQKANLADRTKVGSISHVPIGTEALYDTIYQRDFWPQVDSKIKYLGQDVIIQWFKAPADMNLVTFGFGEAPSTEPNLATQVAIKAVSVNWTEAQLIAATTDSAKHLGYYEAPGNGYNDAEPLIDDFDGINVWTNWHVLDSTHAMIEPFGADILSDGGAGALFTVDPANASADPDNPTYYWVSFALIIFEPFFHKDETFGIAIINTDTTMDDYYVRTWSTNNGNPWGAFKYYANGRNNPGVDYGWWGLDYAWDMAVVVDILSDIEESNNFYPETNTLNQNYPNPFNTQTEIEFSLAKSGKVELIVFDIMGREVAKLVNETKQVGKHEVIFDASKYSSGLYFYRLQSGDPSKGSGQRFIQTRKMLLVK